MKYKDDDDDDDNDCNDNNKIVIWIYTFYLILCNVIMKIVVYMIRKTYDIKSMNLVVCFQKKK